MTECDHVTKVLEWGIKRLDGDVIEMATKYGCTKCDVVSDTWLSDGELKEVDHSKCGGPDVCFGCKARGLQLNTGDSNSQKSMSNKKWDGELNAYRQARSEGIQPSGTSMKAITEARMASEAMGKAYDGDTMGPASSITKESVGTLKEMGAI